ncbi:D-lactate dehydrogenase [Lactobacillus selangorensis]|uniref:D-lactate dehydrogenase n=1 Tax=Lactobacillus selangorensis TaxID=81857 RepID=A0A0R2FVJ9_9LACO|nr:D-2-hydroxyacid dehydrogenase [Lactobacillus selangorensis]KRN28909.1 D-lactate dehydrogenase [Lactobacillus selangorensis]KRN32681.1 D-lactate dehydrogenase [Lactobacillus selangorensis]
MKLIAYDIRDDERPYAEAWAKEHNVDVTLLSDQLTDKTVEKAKGYDGINAYQQLPYTAGVFEKMNEYGIKYISLRNIGTDNVDIPALKKAGVRLTNVPSYSPEAIAELEMAGLMMLLRRMPEFRTKIAQGNFSWKPDIARELQTLTVGIIGTGRIGRAAYKIYHEGFGAKVIGYDVYKNPELDAQGIYVDDVNDLFKQADIVTLHAPATKENYHTVNADTLAEMKDGSYIINTARGDLLDSQALLDSVKSGKTAGAFLDVEENEVGIFNNKFSSLDEVAKKNPVLVDMIKQENIIVTPHVAFYTHTAVKNMVDDSFDALNSMVTTGKADTEVKFD